MSCTLSILMFVELQKYSLILKSMKNKSASEDLYEFPALSVNLSGWGPSCIPNQFRDLLFSLFSRDDNLGMIVELTGSNFTQKQCILHSFFFSCFSIFR